MRMPLLESACILKVKVVMKIISHRGYWKTAEEKNSSAAFTRSFSLGFGTETDLRDLSGRLVISHDPATPDAMSAEEVFARVASYDPELILALNIKADGLQPMVVEAVRRHRLTGCFVFDMAVPDAMQWIDTDIPVFTRHSDMEEVPAIYKESKGVWLDAFRSDWWDVEVIQRHIDAGKQVAVVSPELHGRSYSYVWSMMRTPTICHNDDIILCTDLPEAANEFFTS